LPAWLLAVHGEDAGLGDPVDVEGLGAPRRPDALGHLRRAYLRGGRHRPGRDVETPLQLLEGEQREHRRIADQRVRPEAVDRGAQLVERRAGVEAQEPVQPMSMLRP
jgi:hypothetical protein